MLNGIGNTDKMHRQRSDADCNGGEKEFQKFFEGKCAEMTPHQCRRRNEKKEPHRFGGDGKNKQQDDDC